MIHSGVTRVQSLGQQLVRGSTRFPFPFSSLPFFSFSLLVGLVAIPFPVLSSHLHLPGQWSALQNPPLAVTCGDVTVKKLNSAAVVRFNNSISFTLRHKLATKKYNEVWEVSTWASPAGCWVEPRPKKHFWYILCPEKQSGSNDFGSSFVPPYLLPNFSPRISANPMTQPDRGLTTLFTYCSVRQIYLLLTLITVAPSHSSVD